jgi:NAD(P)H-dependent FMN reductase
MAVGLGVNDATRILLISGSLRAGSTNTAALRTVQACTPEDVEAVFFDGMRDLPQFDPDLEGEALPALVDVLRAEVRRAQALLLSTPEYAGALPGSFKNVLDWLIGDENPGSIYEKPVAWINVSPRGAVHAHESLRLVLGYAHAEVIESACVDVPLNHGDVGDDGLVSDLDARARLSFAIEQLIVGRASRSRPMPSAHNDFSNSVSVNPTGVSSVVETSRYPSAR